MPCSRFWLKLLIVLLVAGFSTDGAMGRSNGSRCLREIRPVAMGELPASERVRRAYSLLRETETFTSTHIDFAGVPSCEVVAFQVLLDSDVADQAFKSLLETATLEGQLYALSGLYFTDRKSFTQHVVRYREMNEKVRTQYGCVIGEELVSAIVDAPDAFGPEALDIAGGGWSREFKNAFK